MSNQFHEYSQKGMEFLKAVAANVGTPDDLHYTDRLARALFSVLRDTLTPQESLHMVSQLPMYIKAVYVNGWKIKDERLQAKTREAFFELLRERYPRTTGRPLGDYQSIRKDVKAVMSVMRNYVDDGELRDIQAQLPKPIAELWEPESVEMDSGYSGPLLSGV